MDAIKLYGQTWVGCKPCNLFCSPFKSLLSHSIYNWGDYYIGEFKDGSKHGQGTYWWADGKKYVGESKNNKWDGHGTFYYADGRKYVGEFVNNNYHGKGTEYTADGQISREGVWADDKYVGKG